MKTRGYLGSTPDGSIDDADRDPSNDDGRAERGGMLGHEGEEAA